MLQDGYTCEDGGGRHHRTLIPACNRIRNLALAKGWSIQGLIVAPSEEGLLGSDRRDAASESIALVTDISDLEACVTAGNLSNSRKAVLGFLTEAVASDASS